jgi:hypothetical protein
VAGDVNACGVIAGSVSPSGKNLPELAVVWRRVASNPPRPICER